MSNSYNFIFGNIWRHTLFVILISIFAAGMFSRWAIFENPTNFVVGTLWSAIIWVSQWFGCGWIMGQLDKRVSWMEQPVKRLLLTIPAIGIYSALAILIVNGTFEYFIRGTFDNFWNWAFETAKMSVGIALIISGIFSASGFFANWRKKEIEAERLKKELINYKYQVLRNQVNPHFLFNSFNVLSDLVYEDQDLAVKFIRQLSDVYRHVLESRDMEFVSLKSELEFMEKFTFLLKIRFGDNLKFDWQVDRNSGYILPMAMQLLVENAVKHNEVSSDKPLTVTIKRIGNDLEVSNPVQPKLRVESSSNFGLEHIRQSYEAISGKTLRIEQSPEKFTVNVPILEE